MPVKPFEGGYGMFEGVPQTVGAVLTYGPGAVCERCEVGFGAAVPRSATTTLCLVPPPSCGPGGVQPEEQFQLGGGPAVRGARVVAL